MSDRLHLHLVSGPVLSSRDRLLFSTFEKEIYLPSFPDDDERESVAEDILPRIADHSGKVRTFAVFLVDDTEKEAPRVVAGEICDWYPSCHDLEIIYVAVNPDIRRGGAGTRILQEGTARIVGAIEKEKGERVRRIYFETENPDKPQEEDKFVMKLQDRVRFFGKNGGAVILEDYYQPPLSSGKGWADNMMLCTLPVFRLDSDGTLPEPELETEVPKEELFEFLRCFYEGLDNADRTPEGKAFLQKMRMSSDGNESVAAMRIEAYAFQIPYAAVTSHLLIDPTPESPLDFSQEDPVFNSYECDLMQYGLQEYGKRPVVTHHYCLLKNVDLHLPARYQYKSEGKCFVVRQWDGRDLQVDVSFNWSYHRKFKRYMVTMVLSPSEGHSFTELDILKIVALSGFGSKQEGFKALEPVRVAYEWEDGLQEAFSFEEFVQSVFRLKERPVMTQTGITDFDLLDMKGEKDFDSFSQMKKQVLCQGPRESVWNKTLCGIILGIFDFMRMNEGEIADTVAPFQVRDTYFTQVCRGNLIQVKFNASDERIDTILTSAYLIIPSVILAFNEEVLRVNADNLAALEKADGRIQGGKRTISDFARFSYLSGEVKKLEASLSDDYIRDIFHYESEQQLMRNGNAQRGLSKSLKRLQEGIDLQRSQSLEYKDKYTSSVDTIQNIILLMLAILQVATIKSMDEISTLGWVSLSLALLAGLFFFFRKRRM